MNYKKYFEKLIVTAKKHGLNLSHSRNNHYLIVKVENGAKYCLSISNNRSRAFGESFTGFVVELYLSKEKTNLEIFDKLVRSKNEIQNELGVLDWQSKEDSPSRNVCRVFSKREADIENENIWDESIEWQVNTIIKFLDCLPNYIQKK